MVSMRDLLWVGRSYGGRLEARRSDSVGDRPERGNGGPPASGRRVVIRVVQQDDVSGFEICRGANGDLLGTRPALPVASPLRPEQGPKAEIADQTEPRAAEHTVRGPVEARLDSGCRGERLSRPTRVVGEQPAAPLKACPMPEAVEPELVAGGRDLAYELRIALDLLAADEEDRGHVEAVQLREHRGRALAMRAVVEREKNSAGVDGRGNPEGLRGDREHGRGRGGPVNGEHPAGRDRERP